jgi:Ca2+-binding RTX toxin-like protein
MPPTRLTLLAVAALLVLAGPASASTVTLNPGGGDESTEVVYTAAPGEANKVSVEIDRGKATIDDPGASSITVQQGCTQQTPKRVVCDLQDSTATIQYFVGDLGDQNDTFSFTALNTNFAGGRVKGGDGDDDLRGGPFADHLDGGVGRDELRGLGGIDFLTTGDPTGAADADLIDGGDGDFDNFSGYNARTTPVTVDLSSPATPAGEAGENDSVTGIEATGGGKAGDTLIGNDSTNALGGGEGDDTLVGRAGHDLLAGNDGNDTISAGSGPDDIEAGAGDDTIDLDTPPGDYDRYVFCADGNDVVRGLVEAFPSVGIDCERVDMGSGIVVNTLPRRVTSTSIAMSIPCPAAFRDANGVCAGKLAVEPRLAFKRSATTRYRTRYGAKAFRFTTQNAKITVPLNSRGRRELRKAVFRFQFTLRLKDTATGNVREFAWTESLNRAFLKDRGVG